ncbi:MULTISPECIES: ClbS/DfsB family four-helix bundle protein [Paenibacillus]|uniref:ClbS/DfsB family four-helix bundle protein n=1 Tax=Paenibacillus TaxID=44249 RepID=UPI0035A25712
MDDSQKDCRVPEVDRTSAEIIAYQLGWLNLVMGWDKDELAGKPVIMPAPGVGVMESVGCNWRFLYEFMFLSKFLFKCLFKCLFMG